MPLDLIADRRADEVRPVGIEAVLHQQIDVTEIDVAEIDRDLLGLAYLRPKFLDVISHLNPTICMDGIWLEKHAVQDGQRRSSENRWLSAVAASDGPNAGSFLARP
jgi:hypothetical protein